jgi:predicted nuclease with TOPRIM domain
VEPGDRDLTGTSWTAKDEHMREQMAARLAELRGDYQFGQARLAELDREQAALRETLLRINGAMQVLEELLGQVDAPVQVDLNGQAEATTVGSAT